MTQRTTDYFVGSLKRLCALGRSGTSVTAVAIAAVLIVSLSPGGAVADDNADGIHWHEGLPTYWISTSVPSSWRIPVLDAASTWGATLFDLNYQGTTSSTSPGSSSTHIVWRGTIPSAWHSGCPPATTLACTRTSFSGNHITDSDIVFNKDKSMGTSDFNCTFLGPVTVDVQSVALHEFGHFGGLGHTSDSAAVMYGNYVTCRRHLHSHDKQSMNNNYPGH